MLLMITDGKKWHYFAVKSLSALFRGLYSYSTENKLKKNEKVCNDHDYCYVEMPDEFNKILKYNHGEESLKVRAIIYADLECLLEKTHSCQNNFEKSDTEKKLSIRLLVIQYLQVVDLTQQKTNLIVTKVKIVWKGFVEI